MTRSGKKEKSRRVYSKYVVDPKRVDVDGSTYKKRIGQGIPWRYWKPFWILRVVHGKTGTTA